MADCVTSFGGVELDIGAWGIDFAYSCTQKCLSAPPGMSPLAVSSERSSASAPGAPVPFSFDLLLLERYWVERPAAYHHTAPILSIYALHEALRGSPEEGLEERWARHARAGAHLQGRAPLARGLELLANPERQLAPLTARTGAHGRGRQARAGADAARARHRDRRRPGTGRPRHLADRPDGNERHGRDGRPVVAALDAVLAEEREPALS